jgi:hypothetical protein
MNDVGGADGESLLKISSSVPCRLSEENSKRALTVHQLDV